MNFVHELVTGPESEPLTLTEAKRHLRMFSTTDEDDDVTALIESARRFAENYTGRVLFDQTWRLTVDREGDTITEIYLRKSPALAIVSMYSVDSDGAETLIDSDTYELREAGSKWPRVVPVGSALWTTCDTLKITFRAGYADTTSSPQQTASVIPATYKAAMKLWIEANYDRGDEMDGLVAAAQNLIEWDRCELALA